MTKEENLEQPASCLNKAAPDEPIFVIRAKDPIGAWIVREWAYRAGVIHGAEKSGDAYAVAHAMEAWRARQA
jgi:hypothetical protein